ncbi:GNAT family N-acetyltransferase [Pseudomaricurvus sp. HS19]|uniref:GNAT family N-acetyltransferase n=1 Tax=Pseudomaricurvus sp. HS19 TaxID=2692626 RepID=UPI00136DE8B2|nr:GNAT family N-acetyltransferase [Pseudomaricurvus sp. HS19]MYM63884.1 GNAT family N-acetyltransferase [Pseudomaricurvus sp. HS19]
MKGNMPAVEEIERQELWDLQQAATADQRRLLGLKCFHLQAEESLVSIAAALPAAAIVINRCFGLESGLTEGDGCWAGSEFHQHLQAVLSSYGEMGVQRYFLQLPAGMITAEVNALLQQHGLQRARGWQEFARGAEPLPSLPQPLAEGIEIRPIGREWAADFGRIACAAFDLVVPDQDPAIARVTEGWIAQVVGRPGWTIFMAFCDGQPAGVGSLFRYGDCGWTNFGATSPQFRGRGIQQALLRARIDWGLQQGVQQFYTCTGVSVPGDPQHSWNNILRVGFRPTTIRENYQPQK